MSEGTVVSIYIARAAKEPTASVKEVSSVPGKGFEGDRYFKLTGTFCAKPGPDYEATLIEIEAIEALQRDYGVELLPGEARRNIVTRGVALNHLVGREFNVGAVALRGIRLCEPCAHLQKLTGRKVIAGLRHRGGLRAQILSEGTIRVGDAVSETNSSSVFSKLTTQGAAAHEENTALIQP